MGILEKIPAEVWAERKRNHDIPLSEMEIHNEGWSQGNREGFDEGWIRGYEKGRTEQEMKSRETYSFQADSLKARAVKLEKCIQWMNDYFWYHSHDLTHGEEIEINQLMTEAGISASQTDSDTEPDPHSSP